MYFSQVPIPQPPESKRHLVERIAEYVIWLNCGSETDAEGPMAAYFEQLLNGLVYELFFEDDLHAQKLTLLKYLGDAKPPPLDSRDDHMKQTLLNEFFQRFSH